MAVDALSRARNTDATTRGHAGASCSARAITSVAACIARSSLTDDSFKLSNAPLERLVLLLCIVQLLSVKCRLLVSQRRGHQPRAHLVTQNGAAGSSHDRAHHDGIGGGSRDSLLMEIVGRVYRAGWCRRSCLASTRSTAILPRERCGVGWPGSSVVRGNKAGEGLGRGRRGSVMAACGRNREARARQERRFDNGVMGRGSVGRRGRV